MINKKENNSYRVQSEGELLAFLLTQLQDRSRTSVKSLLTHRQVYVNGAVQTKYNTRLIAGDLVTLMSGRGNTELKHPKVQVVYEDEYLIVVNKKQGILTVPVNVNGRETTVLSILKAYVKRQNRRNNVFTVHRLDRETSGLLVFAKSTNLQEYMRAYWRQIVKKRTYIALAEGILSKKEGRITTWLTEDKRNAVVYSSPVDDGGDIAITNYKVVKETQTSDSLSADYKSYSYSLVELNLETGRTNQIRVHLASIGHPVVGDRKYGHAAEAGYYTARQITAINRLCLHAKVLEFIHPVTEQVVKFDSPVPKEFNSVFAHVKR